MCIFFLLFLASLLGQINSKKNAIFKIRIKMKMIRFMSVSVETYKHIVRGSSLFDIVMTLFMTKKRIFLVMSQFMRFYDFLLIIFFTQSSHDDDLIRILNSHQRRILFSFLWKITSSPWLFLLLIIIFNIYFSHHIRETI